MKNPSWKTTCFLLMAAAGACTLSRAADSPEWRQFRGPGSRGVAEEAKPPVQFGPDTNLLWKLEVPGGHSSPIVVNDRIAFNAADGKALQTWAVDRKTGRSLWHAEIGVDELEKF